DRWVQCGKTNARNVPSKGTRSGEPLYNGAPRTVTIPSRRNDSESQPHDGKTRPVEDRPGRTKRRCIQIPGRGAEALQGAAARDIRRGDLGRGQYRRRREAGRSRPYRRVRLEWNADGPGCAGTTLPGRADDGAIPSRYQAEAARVVRQARRDLHQVVDG